MTDLTVTITKGSCDHVTIKAFKSGIQVGQEVLTLSELKQEISEYDTAKERLMAQIRAVIIANRTKTIAQIKQAVEAVTYRV